MIEIYFFIMGLTGSWMLAFLVGLWLFLPCIISVVLLTRIGSAKHPSRASCWMTLAASLPLLVPDAQIPSGPAPFLLMPILLALPTLAFYALQLQSGQKASLLDLVVLCLPWVVFLLALLNRGNGPRLSPFG